MTFEDDEKLERELERRIEEDGVTCEVCGVKDLIENFEMDEHDCS